MKILYAMMIALDLLIWFGHAKAQEHEHGMNGIPDWYDPECCNKQDCRPVADDTIDFSDNPFGPILVYTRDDKVKLDFPKSRWRNSKDERYHVCFRGDTVYCAYLPVKA